MQTGSAIDSWDKRWATEEGRADWLVPDPAVKGLPATADSAPYAPILNTDTVPALPLAVSTNCPLGSMAIATGWALVKNGLPVTGVKFKVDGLIRYPLTSPEVEVTYRKRFCGSIATADGVGPSGRGLAAIGAGLPVTMFSGERSSVTHH